MDVLHSSHVRQALGRFVEQRLRMFDEMKIKYVET
jgi:hypothetical protein